MPIAIKNTLIIVSFKVLKCDIEFKSDLSTLKDNGLLDQLWMISEGFLGFDLEGQRLSWL